MAEMKLSQRNVKCVRVDRFNWTIRPPLYTEVAMSSPPASLYKEVVPKPCLGELIHTGHWLGYKSLSSNALLDFSWKNLKLGPSLGTT